MNVDKLIPNSTKAWYFVLARTDEDRKIMFKELSELNCIVGAMGSKLETINGRNDIAIDAEHTNRIYASHWDNEPINIYYPGIFTEKTKTYESLLI